jgi:Xaa-Pro dipeptidase
MIVERSVRAHQGDASRKGRAVNLTTSFAQHVERLQSAAEQALAETGYDALVISSGAPLTYFADDQDASFRPTPHFRHWCPLDGPHHLLHVVPGRRPRLVRYAPEDYWYEQGGLTDPFWVDAFELESAGTLEAAWAALGPIPGAACIGNEVERAAAAGLAINPAPLLARFDWLRSYKDDYELLCLEDATTLGARAHRAAREAFAAGGSELEIHHAFVRAAGTTEAELPFPPIVALDEKAATLHYERKRRVRGGRVLLLDAGVASRGYASDITRTTTAPGCDPRFVGLVARMDELEQELVRAATAGRPYLEVHLQAHQGVARVLSEIGLLRVSAEEALAKDLTRPFFPHGVGHHLGIQVHDVAGRQADPAGTPASPPEEHPYLRNTRTIEPGQVFTIEPGIYFIPMLLRPLREGPAAGTVDWSVVDALAPLGGVRVEDDVLVTAAGPRNLTREALPD